MTPDTCEICGKRIKHMWVGTGTGKAHRLCFMVENPPRIASTASEVINNPDDQVTARQLVDDILTPSQKAELVHSFNTAMYTKRSCFWRARSLPIDGWIFVYYPSNREWVLLKV